MNRLDLLEEDARRSLLGIPAERLAGKTILITGASGLVGTHFVFGLMHCQKQLGLQLQVVGVAQHGVPSHLKQLEQQGYARFLIGNLAESTFLQSLPDAHIIVHAATYAQPALFMENPLVTLTLNTTGTYALLKRLLPGGQFLFISSSELYSGLTSPPFSEDQIGNTNTTHPRSCYIEAKRCGEAICNTYRAQGIDAKSVRLSLAYGPGTKVGDTRAVNTFIQQALRQKAIVLLDPGEAKRTYCYVADAVHMMWRVLLQGKDPIYNVGGTSRTTIADLGRLVGRLLHIPVQVPTETTASLLGAPDDVRLDISRFTKQFGPIDFLSLQEGIGRTIEWQRALYN